MDKKQQEIKAGRDKGEDTKDRKKKMGRKTIKKKYMVEIKRVKEM